MRIIPRTGQATRISVGRTDHGHAVVVAPDTRWPCFCLECSSSSPRACGINDWFLPPRYALLSKTILGWNAEIAAVAQVSNWHKAEEFDGATIATAIQGYNRHAKRVPGMPALDPKAQVNGPCRWASLFHLFPYKSIDAHLSVARKWGRLCRIDEPISFFLDVPDHRCSSP